MGDGHVRKQKNCELGKNESCLPDKRHSHAFHWCFEPPAAAFLEPPEETRQVCWFEIQMHYFSLNIPYIIYIISCGENADMKQGLGSHCTTRHCWAGAVADSCSRCFFITTLTPSCQGTSSSLAQSCTVIPLLAKWLAIAVPNAPRRNWETQEQHACTLHTCVVITCDP